MSDHVCCPLPPYRTIDHSWETADASNASFRLEARLSIVRTLVKDQGLSLYVANAPFNGVTPLGLAAWLDLPNVARVLLEDGQGIVAVNGRDAHGATSLMCMSISPIYHIMP